MIVWIAQNWNDNVVGVYSSHDLAVAALGGNTPYPSQGGPVDDPSWCEEGQVFSLEIDKNI